MNRFLNTPKLKARTVLKLTSREIFASNSSIINLHGDFVPPISHLPAEILRHIFILCLPQTSHFLPKSNHAPMLLTRVCRRWRDIATDMPSSC
ncbi:uncharacterized protein EDB91DRAFT_488371 [Suillus paluster]|uniref:uncharacterized protein n=1 Tax=Suillus paluster TaxID=48578 RepID=UPI001B86F872|nr:uncharacterized protein EDB91DRAFT_488371 [Suillus paluster]KAG1737075.1 hypothetical protein EDB91DRAFT_488371 [Suillus paluster]